MSKSKQNCKICLKQVYKSPKTNTGYYKVKVGGESKPSQIDIDGSTFHKSCAKCDICEEPVTFRNFLKLVPTDDPDRFNMICDKHIIPNETNHASKLSVIEENNDSENFDLSDPIYSRKDLSSNSNPEQIKCKHLSLEWTLDFDSKKIFGFATHHIEIKDQEVVTANFDSSNLLIENVNVNNSSANFEYIEAGMNSTVKVIIPDYLRVAGAEVTIRFKYSTGPNASAVQWLDAAATKGGQYPYVFTQSQAIHARSLLPCFDSPGVKTTYVAEVTAPEWCTVLMSALAAEIPVVTTDDGSKMFNWYQPMPISAYLVALAAGRLASADLSPRVRVWSEPEVIESVAWEFQQTEKFLSIAEELTCPYRWQRYDILCLPPSFPYGGMENPCLTFATPTLLAGDQSLANVIAHEIAHSWTGNLVTNATWSHFWLNEGWTVWLERNIMARVIGNKDVYKLSAQGGWKHLVDDIALLDPEWSSLVWPLKAGNDPDDAFSSVPYEKGFSLLCYLESLVGEDNFLLFVKAYINKHEEGIITSGEFRDFYCSFFPSKQEELRALDWDTLLHSQGLPSHPLPDFTNALADAANSLAAVIISMNESGSTDTSSLIPIKEWSTEQKILFLDLLLTYVNDNDIIFKDSTLQAMDSEYNLTQTKNSEIRFRWQLLCIKSGVSWIYPHVIEFITSQGRMKFVRPLYRALRDCNENARSIALSTFDQHQLCYHPVARKMVQQDLQKQSFLTVASTPVSNPVISSTELLSTPVLEPVIQLASSATSTATVTSLETSEVTQVTETQISDQPREAINEIREEKEKDMKASSTSEHPITESKVVQSKDLSMDGSFHGLMPYFATVLIVSAITAVVILRNTRR